MQSTGQVELKEIRKSSEKERVKMYWRKEKERKEIKERKEEKRR